MSLCSLWQGGIGHVNSPPPSQIGGSAYAPHTYQTTHPLPRNQACWYTESQIENYLNQPLYILRHTGIESEAPVRYPNTRLMADPKVVIRTYDHPGYHPDVIGTYGSSYTHSKDVTELAIGYDQLQRDAVYVKELNISVAIAPHRDRLKIVHPSFVDTKAEKYERAVYTLCQQLKNTPFLVIANDKTGTHDTYYAIINGILVGFPVSHGLGDSFVELRFRAYEAEDEQGPIEIPAQDASIPVDEAFKPAIEVVVNTSNGPSQWFIGTSALHVKELYRKYQISLTNRYTESEFNERLQSSLAPKDEEIRILKQEKDRVSSELGSYKNKIKTLEEVISQYQLNESQQHERARWEWEREKHKRDSVWEERKLQQSHEVAQLKVRKESLSTQASEASMFANLAKAVAIVAPIGLSAFLVMKGMSLMFTSFISKAMVTVFSWLGLLVVL